MDFILDVIINLLAHRTGVKALRLLTGGRFEGNHRQLDTPDSSLSENSKVHLRKRSIKSVRFGAKTTIEPMLALGDRYWHSRKR